jgi:hypothetical protein
MNSDGLKQFLDRVGDAVHSVNTICVGLSGVAAGVIVKPPDMTITWSSRDPTTASARARAFALRGALVFVQEALLDYLNFVALCSNHSPDLSAALKVEGDAKRVTALSRFISDAEPYWEPLVVLLIHWRNKVVHNSRATLTAAQLKVLTCSADDIRGKHAGIDVARTITNFSSGKITLKDFTTLISVTIRFVRHVDRQLAPKVTTWSDFKALLLRRGLERTFKAVMSANGFETRERKLKSFLRAEFPSVEISVAQEILLHLEEILAPIQC